MTIAKLDLKSFYHRKKKLTCEVMDVNYTYCGHYVVNLKLIEYSVNCRSIKWGKELWKLKMKANINIFPEFNEG